MGTILEQNKSPHIWTKDKQKIAKSLAHMAFIELCRRDSNIAIPYILSYGNPELFEQQSFQKEWQDAITNYQWVLIDSPREHGKTNQVSIGRTIYDLGKNPNDRIKIITNSDEKGTEIAMTIATHIKTNPRVHEIFPDLRPADEGMWTKSKIYIERSMIGKDPSLEACGILSTGVGGRADKLRFDDPVDWRNAIQQPALRKAVKEAYRDVWVNLLPPTGRCDYIATPWHKDDLTAELKTESHWYKVTHVIGDAFTPIWPDKWSAEALKQRLSIIGSRAFDRGFRGKVISDEDAIFPMEAIERCYVNCQLGDKYSEEEYVTGVDLGHRSQIESGSFPYTVIMTLGIRRKDGKKRVVGIRRGRFTSPETARQIVDNWKTYKELVIMVENNAYQEAIIQWIREVYGNLDIPVRAFTTGKNKADEEIGLPSMLVELENKSWEFPDVKSHSKVCQCPVCIFVRELNDYPLGKLQDTVMAWWMAREGYRKYCTSRVAIRTLGDENEETKKELSKIEQKIERLVSQDDEDW